MSETWEKLSPRERQVLEKVAEGLANKEIGRTLDPPMTEASVRAHLKSIFLKLDVHSRTAAAGEWFRHGGLNDRSG